LSAAETPGGIPTSQSLSVQSPYKTNFLDIGETHDDSFNNLACPGGKAYTYQAPATTYEPSSSPPPAYSPLPEHLQSAPAPLSAAPFVLTADKDVQRFNGVSDTSPPSVSPSTQQPELESLFQSLHVTSPPSIPPKTPLPPRTTQLHSAKSAGSVLGAIPVGYHSTYQAQIQPAYDSSGNASTQSSEAQQTPANPLVSRHDPASPAYLAPLRGRTPKAVTACIDIPMLFSTDWYWHLEAPDFFICSRCYVDHIWTTKFQDEFQSAKYTDGKPRVCRFSKPRMKYYIFVEALKSGSLRSAIEWMRLRSKIPDCKGVAGVKGKFSTGIQWYRARENAIPGFVSCQACYEDLVMTTQFAPNFELITEPQPMDTIVSSSRSHYLRISVISM
jgi:hypothetical protein